MTITVEHEAEGPQRTTDEPGPDRTVRARWSRALGQVRDAGMATTEYAIVTVAAAGFGGLLLLILRSDEVRGMLVGLVRGALTP